MTSGLMESARRLLGGHEQPPESLEGEIVSAAFERYVPAVSPETRADYAAAIGERWQGAVESIVEVGRLLYRAKAQLPHGDFGAMVDEDLPFGDRTARMLMVIGSDDWIAERISNRNYSSVLPPSWRSLYEITRLSPERRDALVGEGVIHPAMQQRDITTVVKRENRDRREVALAEKVRALPDRRYGVILADPEWRFQPWSLKGMDRAAENHYPTSVAEVIAARDVASIAGPDCVIFLWARADMVPHAVAVLAAWGFDFKTSAVWVKPTPGTGYWFRMQHELVLVGTRGDPVPPAPGTQWSSVFAAPRPPAGHSAKPDDLAEMIERLWPDVPKIELNRRGPPRDGWDAWGQEAEEGRSPDRERENEVCAQEASDRVASDSASESALKQRPTASGAIAQENENNRSGGWTPESGGGPPVASPPEGEPDHCPGPSGSPDSSEFATARTAGSGCLSGDFPDLPTFLQRGHPDCVVK